jgi:hypothetical protein
LAKLQVGIIPILFYPCDAARSFPRQRFKTQSAAVSGIDAYLVEVDVGSARMQDFNVVGLPDMQ